MRKREWTGRLAAGAIIVAGSAVSRQALAAPVELDVDNTVPYPKVRLTIKLPAMPPTRTYCIIDETTGTDSATVEWDPVRPGSLVRGVTLQPPEKQKVKYQIACHSEPARHAIDARVNFAWQHQGGSSTTLDFATCTGVVENKCGQVTATMTLVEKPGLPDAGAFHRFGVEGVRAAVPVAGARAFGPVSEEALNELFRVVAEVAVERAKAKGLKVLQKRVETLLCEDFVRSEGAGGTRWLPRTCDAVKNVRVEDLAGTGQQILAALAQDFVIAGMDRLKQAAPAASLVIPMELQPVIESLVMAVVDMIVGNQERVAGAGQRVLVQLSRADWNAVLPKNAEAAEVMRLAFAIMGEVHRSSKIDASTIRTMLDSPERFFKVGEALKDNAFLKSWAALPAFIAAGARVLSPPADATEASQLRAVIGLVFDVLDFHRSAMTKPKSGALSFPTYGVRVGAGILAPEDRIHLAREMLSSAVQQEMGRLVTSAGALIADGLSPKAEEQRRQITALAGAVGSYLATYASGQKPSEAEIKARHEARKAALNSLIDAQRERGSRLSNWVFSVGASLFPTAGAAYLTDPGTTDMNAVRWTPQFQPMAINLGLAVDMHSKSRVGFHLEFSPINVGNYLTWRGDVTDVDTKGQVSQKSKVVSPAPADALAPALTLGVTYLVPDVDLILLLGPTVSYSFKLGNDDAKRDRAVYIGAALGAYVPFFDFN